MSPRSINFRPWASSIRDQVNEHLGAYFTRKSGDVLGLSPNSIELVEQVRDLTMRGGKRLRPIVMAAAYRACTDSALDTSINAPGAALELMQTFFLIHDDWMDQDQQRRGGPSVHHAFSNQHNDTHIGASLGMLAGDLASTCAWELMLETEFPIATKALALRSFADIHTRVYLGQHLDIIADTDVKKMYQLKTGSYTVHGPALLGGLLADADASQREALAAWAQPLGEAFQLRDDLLGTFGHSEQIGKPGDDVRHGKRTAVIAAFEELVPEEKRGPVSRALGNGEADDMIVADAIALLSSSGAKAKVESDLVSLTSLAQKALADAPLLDAGKALLAQVTKELTSRNH